EQTVAVAGNEQVISFRGFGVTVVMQDGQDVTDLDGLEFTVDGNNASFMVSSSGNYNGEDLVSMTAVDLKTQTLGLDQVTDLLTTANARDGLTFIDSAIDTVNSALGSIGALQNRLEF